MTKPSPLNILTYPLPLLFLSSSPPPPGSIPGRTQRRAGCLFSSSASPPKTLSRDLVGTLNRSLCRPQGSGAGQVLRGSKASKLGRQAQVGLPLCGSRGRAHREASTCFFWSSASCCDEDEDDKEEEKGGLQSHPLGTAFRLRASWDRRSPGSAPDSEVVWRSSLLTSAPEASGQVPQSQDSQMGI